MGETAVSGTLVLASGSPYRRMLLERLGIEFEVAEAAIDETPGPEEPPARMVTRLAEAKARAVAGDYPGRLVIGADQALSLDGAAIGKPGDAAQARRQLQACSGRTATVCTAFCLVGTHGGVVDTGMVPTEVVFRRLGADEIQRYVEVEQPLDCAGSFKVEGLGITLFSRVTSDDPTALIGLPLIEVAAALRRTGIKLP